MEEKTRKQNDCPDETKNREKKKLGLFAKNLLISSCMLLLTIVFVLGYTLLQPDQNTKRHDSLSVELLSRLITLECRFHNVAVNYEEAGFLGMKNTNVWMEFDEIVKLGVDVTKIKIMPPTEDGIIEIYLPPAEVISCNRDISTISKPVFELGLFAEFSGEDEMKIMDYAKDRIMSNLRDSTGILDQAYTSAKNTIEQYVINIGKLNGDEYTVVWITDPSGVENTK